MTPTGTIEDTIRMILGGPAPWMSLAACAGVDAELFHPHSGESTDEAKAVCATCCVQPDCLNYALTNNETNGIWGGMSARERRRLRACV